MNLKVPCQDPLRYLRQKNQMNPVVLNWRGLKSDMKVLKVAKDSTDSTHLGHIPRHV